MGTLNCIDDMNLKIGDRLRVVSIADSEEWPSISVGEIWIVVEESVWDQGLDVKSDSGTLWTITKGGKFYGEEEEILLERVEEEEEGRWLT